MLTEELCHGPERNPATRRPLDDLREWVGPAISARLATKTKPLPGRLV
jgi:hypothetical protein